MNNNNTFFLFSVVKTTQILSRQSQPTHKKGRSSYCMIKIKIDPLVSSVTMQRQEKLVLLLFTLITLSDFLSLRVVKKKFKV